MDMDVLKAELNNDPLGRGYAGMTDEEAASDLTDVLYRTVARSYVAGWEILNATNDAEYAALTAEQKASWDRLCAVEQIDTTSGVAKAREAELFGPGTVTRSNLAALKNPPASRARELGLGDVRTGHVQEARRS